MKAKFYYLTAYSTDDEIRGYEDITALIEHFGDFKTQNLIEKGAIEKLKEVVENIPVMNLQYENRAYLSILRKNIGNETAEGFLKVLEEKDQDRRIGDNLNEIRKIYENILIGCSKELPEMGVNCCDSYGKIIMGRQTADWLSANSHINSIIRNFFFSIKAIASDFGSHSNREKLIFEPTTDTVNSLVYALKDVIRWFGKIMN